MRVLRITRRKKYMMSTVAPESSTTKEALDFDAVVIGAGVCGLYMLYRLRELGLRVRLFETGDGVGGVWYWNRYPGCRVDSESFTYQYSFSQELLDEWDWPETFSTQPVTERYLNHVADTFDLRRDIQLNSKVSSAHYQEVTRSWDVALDDGRRYSTRFIIPALGLLSASASTLPNIPGVESFEGTSCHTSHWPKEPVRFEGKRVAVIGTAASGVQAITEIAKSAGQLTVFQRSPQWCVPLNNSTLSTEDNARIRAQYPKIFQFIQTESSGCYYHTTDPRSTFDIPQPEREAVWEKLYNEPGMGIWLGNFRDILTDRDANKLMSDFLAGKIRKRVKDPATAERLIPKDHGFGGRRVPFEPGGYYEVYNQSNVSLVDLKATPIQRVTPTGIETSDASFEFDIIVYATGFDAFTGAFDRIDFRGVDGLSLKEKWADGPLTFLGFLVDDFPNLMILMGPHGGAGNVPPAAEYSGDWIRELIRFARERGLTRIEATEAGVKEWTDHVIAASEGLLMQEVDSFLTGVNPNVEGKNKRQVVRYGGGHPAFRKRAEAAVANGYADVLFA
jgi:cation diffusion facilitator CzcD-associated flavoprotein CzcO